MSVLSLLLTVVAALCGLFALLYFLCRRLDNYGFVDVAWSYAFAVVAALYAGLSAGWAPRRLLVGGLAVLWSLRLGSHLLKRVAGHHPVEDSRYVRMRHDWAPNFHPKMLGFFQLQAFTVALLSVPFLLPMLNRTAGFHWLEWAGAGLWLAALLGESLADAQLAAFRRDPANRGRVCAVGLWRFSRHPNYFFEWLIWVAYFLIALASPWGGIAIIAPASILFLLLKVSGIPLNEEAAVRSKGDAYRRYQQSTSAFVPWFPKQIP
jgi:steroid 5-alpha reductase family enzyme